MKKPKISNLGIVTLFTLMLASFLAGACTPAGQPLRIDDPNWAPRVWEYPNGVTCYGWTTSGLSCVKVR